MTDPLAEATRLRRPRLLVRAARYGLEAFNRDRTLRRLFASGTAPAPGRAIASLVVLEADLERTRREGDATYNAFRHIEALSALIVETRIATEAARDALN